MAEAREPLRNKLIEIVVQTLIFGALLAGLGFWLNLRLETYKKELADDTERLKAALQSNAPLIQQRRSAYLELQQAARELNICERHWVSRGGRASTRFDKARPALACFGNNANVYSG